MVPAAAAHAETPRPAPEEGPLTDTSDTPALRVVKEASLPRRRLENECDTIRATPLFMMESWRLDTFMSRSPTEFLVHARVSKGEHGSTHVRGALVIVRVERIGNCKLESVEVCIRDVGSVAPSFCNERARWTV